MDQDLVYFGFLGKVPICLLRNGLETVLGIVGAVMEQAETMNYFEFASELVGRQPHDVRISGRMDVRTFQNFAFEGTPDMTVAFGRHVQKHLFKEVFQRWPQGRQRNRRIFHVCLQVSIFQPPGTLEEILHISSAQDSGIKP